MLKNDITTEVENLSPSTIYILNVVLQKIVDAKLYLLFC